jgi:hypothetical protein
MALASKIGWEDAEIEGLMVVIRRNGANQTTKNSI